MLEIQILTQTGYSKGIMQTPDPSLILPYITALLTQVDWEKEAVENSWDNVFSIRVRRY